MDTAKLEKQVIDAGKVTRYVGWFEAIIAIPVAAIFWLVQKEPIVAVINLILVGGIGYWAIMAGGKAKALAEAKNYPAYRKTLKAFNIALIVFSVIVFLSGGRIGILAALVLYWNFRAIKSSQQLEMGGAAGPGAPPAPGAPVAPAASISPAEPLAPAPVVPAAPAMPASDTDQPPQPPTTPSQPA